MRGCEHNTNICRLLSLLARHEQALKTIQSKDPEAAKYYSFGEKKLREAELFSLLSKANALGLPELKKELEELIKGHSQEEIREGEKLENTTQSNESNAWKGLASMKDNYRNDRKPGDGFMDLLQVYAGEAEDVDLPFGWHRATDSKGKEYFWSDTGETSWSKPEQKSFEI